MLGCFCECELLSRPALQIVAVHAVYTGLVQGELFRVMRGIGCLESHAVQATIWLQQLLRGLVLVCEECCIGYFRCWRQSSCSITCAVWRWAILRFLNLLWGEELLVSVQWEEPARVF